MKNDLAQIIRKAKWLNPQNGIFLLSDNIRAPDIAKLISNAPICARIILRENNIEAFQSLLPRKNRNKIAASIAPKMAIRHEIGGIHIPNKRLKYFHQSKRHKLHISSSAHSSREINRAILHRSEVILISSAFKSESPSAKKALGPIKIAKLVRQFPNANLVALGGINVKTIMRLKHTGIRAIAGVSFRKSPLPHEQP